MAASFADDIERRIGGLLDRVPGYRGYRVKEDRRDADRRLREHLVTVYSAEADRVERVARDLATKRRINDVAPVDEFATTLRHFIDRVRTATYGYGGLMGDRDVDSGALDQLRQFDESLVSGVDELSKPIGDLETALTGNGDLAAPAAAGTAVVRSLLARFDLRSEVVETAKPAPEASVMRALQAPRSAGTSSPFDLQQGDALAILGDDYIVDARIAIDAQPMPFRLLRLTGGSGEQWLAVAQGADGLALLAPVTPAPEPGATTIGGVAYTPRGTGSGDGEVTGIGGTSGLRPVRFTMLNGAQDVEARAVIVDWGTERQAFAGRSVHPGDVEIFGRPSAQLN